MIDLIIGWVAETIGLVFDALVTLMAPVLGFSFETFVNTFPYANTVYLIFQRCALVLVVIIAVVHLWGWFFPTDQRLRSTPIRTVYCTLLAVGFIYFGNYLLQGILDLCEYPFTAIANGDSDTGYGINFSLLTIFTDSVASNIALIVFIIIDVMIGVAFVKLMLEAVERYIVLFLLIYASPLAAATLASDATKDIYKKYFTMFVSQCLLMVLNIWILKLAASMFQNLTLQSNKIIALLLGWGVLKVGARLDSYVNQLGLNAAVTGMGLASEIGAVAGTILRSGQTGGSAGFGAGGQSGGLWGAVKGFSSAINKYNPMAAIGVGAKNYGAALVKSTVGSDGLVGLAVNRAKGNAPAPKGTWSKNFSENMKKAGMKTQENNLAARAIGQAKSGAASRFSDGSATSMDRENVAKYSHIADNVFQGAIGGEVVSSDPKNVAAVMQGIGFENTHMNAGEFTNAAYGNTAAENVDFSMGADGISASYTKDGQIHSASIINAAQYDDLIYEKQDGFTKFKSEDGTTYYYKTSTTPAPRSPGEAQKASADFSAGAKDFVSSPSGTLSPKNYAYLSRHPEAVNEVFSGFKDSGVTITDQKQIGHMLQAMHTSGIPAKTQSDAVNALFAGDASSASMNSNGMSVSYFSNDGRQQHITMLTEARINALGADYIADRGYTMKNIGGQQYAFLHERDGDNKDFSEK